MLEIGKTYFIQNPITGDVVSRKIISIEEDRVFYRKSEKKQRVGQCNIKAFEKLIEGQMDLFELL